MSKNQEDNKNSFQTLPAVPLKDIVVLPKVNLAFELMQQSALLAVRSSFETDRKIVLLPHLTDSEYSTNIDDYSKIACLAQIEEVVDGSDDEGLRVRVMTLTRCRVKKLVFISPYFELEVETIEENELSKDEFLEAEAVKRALIKRFRLFHMGSSEVPNERLLTYLDQASIYEISDIIASNINAPRALMLQVLTENNPLARLYILLLHLEKERRLASFSEDLEQKVKLEIDKGQREYYLRQKIKVINEELGDGADNEAEIEEFKNNLAQMNVTNELKNKITKEINKLQKIQGYSPDASVIRSYLDLFFSLPWGKTVEEELNIIKVKKVLEREHYGLKEVKTRLLEHLATRKRQLDNEASQYKSPIICLVGPPGVGKTSIALSIAKAIGRPCVRLSLGGVKDEADIRGHRRTYVGAMPGRVINAIKQAKVDNMMLVFDEIDKLGADYKGDPSSALLEVLDPEQNKTFHDHYLDLDYDLSKILFMTTANDEASIPAPLLDRMEIIRLYTYTEEEKYNIASKYLWKKQLKEHFIKSNELALNKAALLEIIRSYTRESGVRNLEQQLAKICRKYVYDASLSVSTETEENAELSHNKIKITKQNLVYYLGKTKYHYDRIEKVGQVGLAMGLAWTAVGGETLNIEVSIVSGTGKIVLTGNLGEVMQESAKVAISYLRASLSKENDTEKLELLNSGDIHIHVPEAAVSKDGPSAGITMVTAIYSALHNKAVRNDLAMTGEVTIRGRVLAIGGLKEKLIAAARSGVKEVIIPAENRADIDDTIPQSVLKALHINYVKQADEVLRKAIIDIEKN